MKGRWMPPARNNRSFVRDLAHVTLLFGLAVAQPLYSVIGKQPEFLVAQGMDGTDTVVLAMVLSFALPAVWMSALRITVGWQPTLYGAMTNATVVVLAGLAG